jgi:hypothetical protein
MAMSIKQANVPSVIFLFSAHSRGGGGGGGVVHGTNFVGGGAVSGDCRGRSHVGPIPTPEKQVAHSLTKKTKRRKEENKKNRMTLG